MKGWDALVFYPDSDEGDEKKIRPSFFFRRAFKATHLIGEIDVPIGNGARRSSRVFLCEGMKEWPESVPAQLAREPELKQIFETKHDPP